MPQPIVIPDLRSVVRHALPNVIEGKVIPTVLFVAFFKLLGIGSALLVALGWSLAVVGYRCATSRRISGLIVLTTVALIAKTIAALATGSTVFYFLQSTVTTILVGLAFMISVPLGNPLAQKLAYDVFPFDDATKSHPQVKRFFVRLSLMWSITSLANAAMTVWLLFTQSTTTFVLVKSVSGPITAAVTVGTMFLWLRVDLAKSSTPLIWAKNKPERQKPQDLWVTLATTHDRALHPVAE